ncbi:MAG TPA: DUF427 domain-containing protein [Trebonia sp.]|jgi:uncharacterized protein (DUF427 family)|nr:DUF427 domain-containing protein [Trebonia sp.]
MTQSADTATSHGARRVRTEPNHRRVRVFFGGQAVADSSRTIYLFETGHLPVYYFPREDVRFDLLEPTSHHTHCPWKGDASYYDVVAGGRRAENAVWAYPAPIDSLPELKDFVAFYWDKADAWFEEDDEVYKHARDPYHRVDVLNSSRHVEVRVNGVLVADTRRPRVLFETGLPVRYYVPKLDVRQDLLIASARRSRCPYKGEAVYWSVQAGDEVLEDIAWSYPSPIPEAPKIENLLAFFNEKVDITVDGAPQERPVTKWS